MTSRPYNFSCEQGEDWSRQVAYRNRLTGTVNTVTDPVMEIRKGPSSTYDLVALLNSQGNASGIADVDESTGYITLSLGSPFTRGLRPGQYWFDMFVKVNGQYTALLSGKFNVLPSTVFGDGPIPINPQGPQGVPGNQGNQGFQGLQGFQGATGSQGAQGLTGTGLQGSQGATGTGNQGAQGVPGPQGFQGASGGGSAGQNGPQGAQGSSGPQGNQGNQGASGAAGSQGNQGLNGAAGPQGTTGAAGSQGFQGFQGDIGNQGAQGNQGNQGYQGTNGSNGSPGSQGNQGTQGFQGNPGTAGNQGAPGAQGNQGNQGFQGAAGTNGNQGNQGAAGANGAQGNQGFQGANGNQGFQGAQGNQGTSGAAQIDDTTSSGSKSYSSQKVDLLVGQRAKTLDALGIGPTFTRTGNKVFQASQSSAGSIYWWNTHYAVDKLATPLDKYYAYYTTDHTTGPGGVYLCTAPTPEGPWTDRGQVYVDTQVAGRYQTENCAVIWDEVNVRFNLYYKAINSNGAMYTHLATSPDGVTWTYVKQILNLPGAENPGNANVLQGYFAPFRIGGLWIAYSILAGGSYGCYAKHLSNDGVNWQTDPRPIWNGGQSGTQGLTGRISPEGTIPFVYKNKTYGVWRTSPLTSGTGGGGNDLVVAPFADNLRTFLGTPKPARTGTADSSESTNIRSQRVFADPVSGKLYLYYITATSTATPVSDGILYVATAG